MTKKHWNFLFLVLLTCFAACKQKTKEKQPETPARSIRAIPLEPYQGAAQNSVSQQTYHPNLMPIEGTTEYVLVENVTDYAWLKKKSQEDGVTYLPLEKIPREEVFSVAETSGPFKIARYQLDDASHLTLDIPKEWELYSDSGVCDMDCDPSYDAMFQHKRKDGVKFEIAVEEFSTQDSFERSLDFEQETTGQPSGQWQKEKLNLEDIKAELVSFIPDKLAKQDYGLTILSDFLVFKPNVQARVFRLLPQLPRARLMVYLALHGNNPSKKDMALARRVILSFRYHEHK